MDKDKIGLFAGHLSVKPFLTQYLKKPKYQNFILFFNYLKKKKNKKKRKEWRKEKRQITCNPGQLLVITGAMEFRTGGERETTIKAAFQRNKNEE